MKDTILKVPEEQWEKCPICDDVGWYADHDPYCDGDCETNCPVQVQCEFCYGNGKSIFNQKEIRK